MAYCHSTEKEGKALQLTYQTKLKLIALTKQAAFGKFRPDVSPDVGFLDVVGNDRRYLKYMLLLIVCSAQLPFCDLQKCEYCI